jgi:hypothetical protein
MAMRHSGTLKARNVDEGEVTRRSVSGDDAGGAQVRHRGRSPVLVVSSARRQDRRTHDRLAGLREVIERQ